MVQPRRERVKTFGDVDVEVPQIRPRWQSA
jgi:hypothetical protein